MEQAIKQIRVDLDGLFKITATLKPSREVALAKTHFEESKMSLGKVLAYLGAANPYPESKNPDSKVIEKTADTEERGFFFKDPTDHIGNVKSVRKDADDLSKKIADARFEFIDKPLSETERTEAPKEFMRKKLEAQDFFKESWMDVQKGMMWLGMELGRIKAEEDKAKLEAMPQSPGQNQE
jgi:hypothetical protein